jgi:hypothetical protein
MLTPSSKGALSCANADKAFVEGLVPLERAVLDIGHDLNTLMVLQGKVPLDTHVPELKDIHQKLRNILNPYLLYHKLDVPVDILH